MTSDFQERVRLALAKRNLACPNLVVEEAKNAVRFFSEVSEVNTRYCSHPAATEMNSTSVWGALETHDKDAKSFDAMIKELSKQVSAWRTVESNYQNIASLDAFFNLSGIGTIETPIEIDRVFLNVLERAGYTIEQVLEGIRCELHRKDISRPSNVRDIVVSAFTNLDIDRIFDIFHVKYRNMHEIYPRFGKALPFQLCVWGSHIMATDIRLAVGVHYRSSVTPTITLRGREIPESALSALKGQPINRVIDTPLFSDDVKIRHVTRNKNVINVGIEADRVDITHLGWQVQPIKKAA